MDAKKEKTKYRAVLVTPEVHLLLKSMQLEYLKADRELSMAALIADLIALKKSQSTSAKGN